MAKSHKSSTKNKRNDGHDSPPPAKRPRPVKKKKDPLAPKKNWTSFMFFSNAKRAEIVQDNPEATFGQVAKLVGEGFKRLDTEDKQIWIDRAIDDKARYLREMEDYTPPEPDTDEETYAIPKKDKNAPKKGLSSYNFFFQAVRPDVVEENPNAKFADISKIIGAKFRGLSADEKSQFDVMAKEDKQRYLREMDAYELKYDVKKTKPKKDPNAPKKNLSSYMIFTQECRADIKARNPGVTFGELNKLLGAAFKNLDEEEKMIFTDKAQVAKGRYLEEMKVYNKEKKERETQQAVSSSDESDDTDSADSSDSESDTEEDSESE